LYFFDSPPKSGVFLLYLYCMKTKKSTKEVVHKIYERVFTHSDCTIIWKYDTNKSTSGPFEVEIKYPKKKG